MGTYYALTIADAPPHADRDELHRLVRGRLDRIEALMSTYRADSDVSRINDSPADDWVPVSPETVACVESALDVGHRSGGTYDMTIGPVVNLWGFGPAPRTGHLPTQDGIDRARRSVGADQILVRRDPPALRKLTAGVRIDLASVAKGLAVDLACEALEQAGVRDYCLDVGGEVRVRGHNPDGRPWQVAIEAPTTDEHSVQRLVPLTGGAVATSGNYRIFIEHDGTRYSHLIDPRTGWPVRHELVSVSVLHPSCARADAWATALLVAGPEEGEQLALREELNAVFIVQKTDGIVERVIGRGWPDEVRRRR